MKHYNNTKSYKNIYEIDKRNKTARYSFYILLLGIIAMFLPWTQNIKSNGKVTTLRQETRSQKIYSIIAGKIVNWYVKEGDIVKSGDTLLQIAEVKDDYMDPQLLTRTQEQIDAKSKGVYFYEEKANANQKQIDALQQGMSIKKNQINNKLKQIKFKITSDSAQCISAENDYQIAVKQYNRQKELFDQGLVSLVQLEQRNLTLQNALAKNISAQNTLANSKQELSVFMLELNAIEQEYLDKINKAQSESMSAMSQSVSNKAEVSKLQNQISNYKQRTSYYYITASQDGQVVQVKKSGIGEMLKEGEVIGEMVPTISDNVVEIFVNPLDIPLLSLGQKVRLIFDGFPAIVFSGWPQASYGTFVGKVYTIENNLSPEGKYRVLVAPDIKERAWPPQIRLGAGVQAIALLKNVPIWYELWRNINGFPPDFYKPKNEK